MHGPNFFSLHFLPFYLPSFPKINHFYYFTSLHGLQDLENHCAHLRQIALKTSRKISYLRFPGLCIILYIYNWNREHEAMEQFLERKKILRIQKKDTSTSTKRHEWNGMTQKWTFWYFQQWACLNAIYFKPVVTTTYRMKNNKSSTRGLILEKKCLCKSASALVKY